MYSEKHLNILKLGASVWNKWRIENYWVQPYLSNIVFVGADLRHAKLSYAKLYKADLSMAKMAYANLTWADLSYARLSHTNLREANLSFADMRQVRLDDALLEGANLSRSNLSRAELSESNLNLTDLSGANLSGAVLRSAALNRARMRGAILTRADLWDANLRAADLTGADLVGANLGDADLKGANLSGADLSGTILRRANLNGVNLSDANLDGADLGGTLIGRTLFCNNNLSSVKGLETVRPTGPSTVGVDTLYKSGDSIPSEFLVACNLPEVFITYIPSLLEGTQALRFYSCFISYSNEDEAFARQLYSSLRRERLQVWFAPEDMKRGQKIYEQIDRAIQVHDRLLFILSEHSLTSKWVETEIRRARKAEREGGRRKLFPILIAGYEALRDWVCIDSVTGEDLAEEVRQYFIPDFSNWREQDSFKTEFAKLLRDLRAVEV
jgi:uncharacterized protein YjbI with pentapeptide repeats